MGVPADGDLRPLAPPLTLILAHPNPSMSVNELEDPGVIEGSVRGACLLVKGW